MRKLIFFKKKHKNYNFLFIQKANEKDAYGNQKDRIQKLEEDNLFYANKIKLLEDNLAKSKAEFSSTWKSLMEKEKYTKELQNDVNFIRFIKILLKFVVAAKRGSTHEKRETKEEVQGRGDCFGGEDNRTEGGKCLN